MAVADESEPPSFVRMLAKTYAVAVLLVAGLAPTVAIAYLYLFQNPPLRFENHSFHEIAIGVSLLQSGFIAYVTWRCYLYTGEHFLRWLTLAFLGFAVVYFSHGVFTGLADEDPLLFTLYGPASRLTMALCLLAGLIAQRRPPHGTAQRSRHGHWYVGLITFMAINCLVFLLSLTSWGQFSQLIMEFSALFIFLACASTVIVKRSRSALMTILVLALLFFAQSSLAFLMSSIWTHMWWLAHAIFLAGFMALSYGVVHAFLTTRSFTEVFSQSELMDKLRIEKARAEDFSLQLQNANEELAMLAATDSLTGGATRREFETRAAAEIGRSERSGEALSFVAIDLDYFKKINDRYGHQAGDQVLKAFVTLVRKLMRQSDLIGRLGGEEFAMMLPSTDRKGAAMVAERLRQSVDDECVSNDGHDLRFTASFGVAQYGVDGDTYESVMDVADSRMYRAKENGRNQVVHCDVYPAVPG